MKKFLFLGIAGFLTFGTNALSNNIFANENIVNLVLFVF